jgi:hypothetical protein
VNQGVAAFHPIIQHRTTANRGDCVHRHLEAPWATDADRLTDISAGRIPKGTKPDDLPVRQSTRLELSINLKIAKALGLNIPPSVFAITGEAIEWQIALSLVWIVSRNSS